MERSFRCNVSFLCISEGGYKLPRFLSIIFFTSFIFLGSKNIKAEPLATHLKQFTRMLSGRNLDSLRLFIDPNRIYVEITPKEGAFLSASQTLVVVESFFQLHSAISFSYGLIKEKGNTGIALGTLVVSENGRSAPYKVSFGFQKNGQSKWILSRISIH